MVFLKKNVFYAENICGNQNNVVPLRQFYPGGFLTQVTPPGFVLYKHIPVFPLLLFTHTHQQHGHDGHTYLKGTKRVALMCVHGYYGCVAKRTYLKSDCKVTLFFTRMQARTMKNIKKCTQFVELRAFFVMYSQLTGKISHRLRIAKS